MTDDVTDGTEHSARRGTTGRATDSVPDGEGWRETQHDGRRDGQRDGR